MRPLSIKFCGAICIIDSALISVAQAVCVDPGIGAVAGAQNLLLLTFVYYARKR